MILHNFCDNHPNEPTGCYIPQQRVITVDRETSALEAIDNAFKANNFFHVRFQAISIGNTSAQHLQIEDGKNAFTTYEVAGIVKRRKSSQRGSLQYQ